MLYEADASKKGDVDADSDAGANGRSEQYKQIKKQLAAGLKKRRSGASEVCKVLFKANKELTKNEYKSLIDGVKVASSTRRKLKKIGSSATRFEPHLKHLPLGNWTTLYLLARLKTEEFQQVVKSGKLKPDMEAKTIDEVLGDKTPTKKKANRDLTIDMKDLAVEEMIKVYEVIEDLLSELKFEIIPGSRMLEAIARSDAKKKTE